MQAALEKMGFEGTASEVAGNVAKTYEATEKYGGAFWDAAGGDYSTITSMGQNFAGLYAINKTFGEGFAGNTPQQQMGSQFGQAAGAAVGGPFGAIAGGMMGAILGASLGELFGLTTPPDFDFVTRSGTGGFEDNRYVTTPFGNFGFNAGSTRDLSMSKQGSAMLESYGKAIIPMDVAFASVMTQDEVGEVKNYMSDNLTENSHVYKPDEMLKIITRQRLDAIDKTMSDQRKLDTGFQEMVNQWNENLAGGYDSKTYKDDPNYRPMQELFSRQGSISQVSYNNDVGVEYGAQEGDYILRSEEATGFGGRSTKTFNVSQAIREGNFSAFEQRAMEKALLNHYEYTQKGTAGLGGRRGTTNLSSALDLAVADAIQNDKRYAI